MIIQGLDDEHAAVAGKLLDQLSKKSFRNQMRTAYYNAHRLPSDLGVALPPGMASRLGAVLGWPAKAVDALVQRVHWQGASSEQAQGLVDEITEASRLDLLLPQAFTSSLEHGVSFLVAGRGPDGGPQVAAVDALNGTGLWDHSRQRLGAFMSVTERDEHHAPSAVELYLPGGRVDLVRDGDWQAVEEYTYRGDPAVPVEMLAYRQRLGRPFGMSRISRPVMAITDMAARTVIRSEVGAEFYAIPQRWLMGADASSFGLGDSGAAMWKILVGRIMALDDDDEKENPRAEVGQFPQASQQPHMDQLRSLAQLFAGETSIPVSSLGISIDSNPTSADSYAASREDIIAEAEQVIASWRHSLDRVMGHALRIAGVEGVRVGSSFRDPRYISRSASADALLKVSTVLPWLGSTPEAIDMLGMDDVLTERLKMAQRRQGARSLLDTLSALPSREG